MKFNKITEKDSKYDLLEKKSVLEIISEINFEDTLAVDAVKKVLPDINKLIKKVISKLKNGGRLFYIGAGTSGRIGVLDASECPPTFGTDPSMVVGIIAGGDIALRNSIEFAEDSSLDGWKELLNYNINKKDFVLGIASSGTTPFVVGALKKCQENNITTGCICSNPKSPITIYSDHPIEVLVGPEYITGSTRMKAGTCQKLILNMISTATMIKLGHIKGNKMIDIQLTNKKLKDRATRIVKEFLNIDYTLASKLIKKYGNVRDAIEHISNDR
ncbi:MAG: N-acetylmuramic acid 6-phosphate etherase [Flavobacteriaceae bacterium]|nr:N-acetylmuramic acid 6-phosphate etherase [Flavobacteriaceae bacterium]|tara:strand:- start:8431 stop:9249 length:819 start_codon:yes stop_codon:yes gene_type:complete